MDRSIAASFNIPLSPAPTGVSDATTTMSLLATDIPRFLEGLNQLMHTHPVQLIAVSKTQSAECLREAFHLGLRTFGENYVQEALDKQSQLSDLQIGRAHV